MSVTYLEAIREAQARALADDPRVFIYGQDVGAFGGAFKATKNLANEYPGRVIDAPISEDAMVGAAIGAALQGMRPIIDFRSSVFWGVEVSPPQHARGLRQGLAVRPRSNAQRSLLPFPRLPASRSFAFPELPRFQGSGALFRSEPRPSTRSIVEAGLARQTKGH